MTTTNLFFGLVLLVTATTGFGQTARAKHAPPPTGDGVASAKQFVKVMFPTLRGSDLMINYTLLDDRLDLPVPSYRLEFVVQKFCNPPSDAKVALIGNMFRPCGEYDKNYKDPLTGEICYRLRDGRLSLFRGNFAGAMVRVPEKGKATTGGVCTEQTFVTKEDVVSSIPRKALAPRGRSSRPVRRILRGVEGAFERRTRQRPATLRFQLRCLWNPTQFQQH